MKRNRGWYKLEQRREQPYEERLLKAYDRWEKPLFRLILLGFALLVIIQGILATDSGRMMLSAVDRMEGERTDGAMPVVAEDRQPAQLTIRSVGPVGDLNKVWVKVDGIPVDNFEHNEVTIAVRQDDVVTIDTSAIEGLYRFEIDHNDPHMSYPTPGLLVESNQGQPAEIGPIDYAIPYAE